MLQACASTRPPSRSQTNPRPNSTPSLSVSLEIFQSFISRSFIFDGDPPPPLGRFTVAVGFGRPRARFETARRGTGSPLLRGAFLGAPPPGAGSFWAPRGSRRRCGCGCF